ncbi:MAG: hypothetical protein CMH46_03760 [Muricauda sp.]|nr:hypothetical protein [Allomuricauda sp.]
MVLASNRLNQRNFTTVEDSVDSVYKDRLVVQEYIYTLNNLFHKKELFLTQNDWDKEDMPQFPVVEDILADFSKTVLTTEESMYLTELKDNYSKLKKLELENDTKEEMVSVLNKISENLDELSKVQLMEGEQLTQRSKRSLGMNQLLSSLEIVFLIIIGLLFLIIVFKPEKPERPEMKLVEEDS